MTPFDLSTIESWDRETVLQFLNTWTTTLDKFRTHPTHAQVVQTVSGMAKAIEQGTVPVEAGHRFIRSRLAEIDGLLGMAPAPTGRVDLVDLAGGLLAIQNGQLVVLRIMGGDPDVFYLPVFHELEPFAKFLGHSNLGWDGFKKIDDDPTEFLGSLPPNVRVMVTPWFTEEGRVRWLEVQPNAGA